MVLNHSGDHVDVSHGFDQSSLPDLRFAGGDTGIDVFDASYAIGTMLQATGGLWLAAGKKDDVARRWQYMKSFKRDEVDGGAVVE